MLRLLCIYLLNILTIILVTFHQNLNVKYPVVFVCIYSPCPKGQKCSDILQLLQNREPGSIPDRSQCLSYHFPNHFRSELYPDHQCNFGSVSSWVSRSRSKPSWPSTEWPTRWRRPCPPTVTLKNVEITKKNWNQQYCLNEGLFVHIYSLIFQRLSFLECLFRTMYSIGDGVMI